jgi:hypothetical protein
MLLLLFQSTHACWLSVEAGRKALYGTALLPAYCFPVMHAVSFKPGIIALLSACEDCT